MKIYHGAHTKYELHEGQCYTDDEDSAISYAEDGFLTTCELEMRGLKILEDVPYDREDNSHPTDFQKYRDKLSKKYDVVMYDDEDPRGQPHKTIRLLTKRAIKHLTVMEVAKRGA